MMDTTAAGVEVRAEQLALADGYASWESVDGYAQASYLERAAAELAEEES